VSPLPRNILVSGFEASIRFDYRKRGEGAGAGLCVNVLYTKKSKRDGKYAPKWDATFLGYAGDNLKRDRKFISNLCGGGGRGLSAGSGVLAGM